MRQRLTKWSINIFLVLLLGALAAVVNAIFSLTEIASLTLDRFLKLALLLGLVGVTAVYAYSTNSITKATRQLAEHTARQMHQSVRPILM
ncbi:MAG: hypothetical protein EXR55_06815 [Dehalococcoidia bacterium]|nr:hypothetical protein [Dehalococcoidia bacterium]